MERVFRSVATYSYGRPTEEEGVYEHITMDIVPLVASWEVRDEDLIKYSSKEFKEILIMKLVTSLTHEIIKHSDLNELQEEQNLDKRTVRYYLRINLLKGR